MSQPETEPEASPEPAPVTKGWIPCKTTDPCENCGHKSRGHFRWTGSAGTGCGECDCQHWACKHGGVRAVKQNYPVREVAY